MNRPFFIALSLAASLFALGLAACAQVTQPVSNTTQQAPVEGQAPVTAIDLNGSVWGASPVYSGPTGKPTITFLPDGTITGSNGCGQIAGHWSEANGTITFTRDITQVAYVACPEMETWLTDSHSGVVSNNGNTIVFRDRSGTETGSLDRFEG